MKKGFTLIEALVAIAILALSVGGPMYAASRALVAAQNSKNQLTAVYLAQEGIEYIRKLRDDTFLQLYNNSPTHDTTTAWAVFLVGSVTQCTGANGCTLDPWNSPALQSCGATCQKLYLDSSTPQRFIQEQYMSVGDTPQPFTRKINVITVPSSTEVQVVSTVSWSSHNIPYSVTLTDHLTSWQ